MTLLKWTDGETITERSSNNKSIRKGTEAEIAAILTADRELGDVVFNSTVGFIQVQTAGGASDKRGNLNILLDANSTLAAHVGNTPTEMKTLNYVKDAAGFKGNTLSIIARIKSSNAGTTAHFRVRLDGAGSDSLDLTTTSVTEVILTGTIDISAIADGYHTIEFFGDDGVGDTITNTNLEVWGI